MSNKINGKFYALQPDEWTETTNKLTRLEIQILYVLRSIDPYSRGIDIKSRALAERFKTTQRSVNRAIAKLKELDLLEAEPVEWHLRLKVLRLDLDADVQPMMSASTPTVLASSSETLASRLEPETLTQQEVQNPKNIKINKIQLDPFLDPEAEEKNSKLISNDQELISNSSLRLKPDEDSSCKQNSLSRSIVPQPALPISAYDRWAATAHPALIFDGDRTPWLVPPQGKTFIRFLEEFIAWGANEFTREYGKSDFYKARADFRSYLLNHPDKVEDKWEQYCSQVTHKAVVMASRIAGGVSVEPEEFQFLLENNQAIANPELLQVDFKVLESVVPQGAEGVASYQLYSSDATQFWKTATEKCSRKMPQVAPCEVPKPELEWLNELIHSGNKSLIDMAVRKAKARGYFINQDGDCIYSITTVEV